MSNNNADEMCRLVSKMKQDLLECEENIQSANRNANAAWDTLAGPYKSEMLRTSESAELLVENPDPKVRMAALVRLRDHWKPANFWNICEKMTTDADEQVSNIAVISMGRYFQGTFDAVAGRRLAHIVHDASRTDRQRNYAYTGLFQIRGLPVDTWPIVQEGFAFPSDVDWAFVDSFLAKETVADR